MRKLSMILGLAVLLALGAVPAARAQYGDNGGGQHQRHRHLDPDAQLQRMTKELGLSANQQSQIRPILVDRQQKMQALWQNQSLSREDRRSQMMSIRQDTRTKIEALLTDQQRQTFEAMQQGRGHHGSPGEQGQPQPQ